MTEAERAAVKLTFSFILWLQTCTFQTDVFHYSLPVSHKSSTHWWKKWNLHSEKRGEVRKRWLMCAGTSEEFQQCLQHPLKQTNTLTFCDHHLLYIFLIFTGCLNKYIRTKVCDTMLKASFSWIKNLLCVSEAKGTSSSGAFFKLNFPKTFQN